MKLKQNFHGGNNNRQLNVFDHLVSQKVHSFRTLSKLLEAQLQYGTALSYTCGVQIFELKMSLKFEVNFESLFERLVDYTVW